MCPIGHTGNLNQFRFWHNALLGRLSPDLGASGLRHLSWDMREHVLIGREIHPAGCPARGSEQHGTEQAYSETFELHLVLLQYMYIFMRFWNAVANCPVLKFLWKIMIFVRLSRIHVLWVIMDNLAVQWLWPPIRLHFTYSTWKMMASL